MVPLYYDRTSPDAVPVRWVHKMKESMRTVIPAFNTERMVHQYAVRAYLSPAFETHSIALSLEMRDIDPDLSPKTGTIRDYLANTTQET